MNSKDRVINVKFGIRDYLVKINPPTYCDFIVAYDRDNNVITSQEEMDRHIGSLVACIHFSDAGQMYRRYYAKLLSAKIIRDTNVDQDSWDIEIKPYYETEVVSKLNNDVLK